ncbi:hypothetical protein Z043_125896, partial [Scleropages formosus]
DGVNIIVNIRMTLEPSAQFYVQETLPDAKIVCRQLGCGTPVQVQGAAIFGKGDGKVWKNKIECR